MTHLMVWLKRTRLRNIYYKLIVICGVILFLWLSLGVILPLIQVAWSNLATRTPLGQARLVKVEVSADHLSNLEKDRLRNNPQRVAAHQVKPNLQLLGLGQELIESQGSTRFVVGLLPAEAKRVLKSETQVSLRVQAPSLELLTQELIYSPKGQMLRDELSQTQNRIVRSWLTLWPELKSKLQAILPTDLFEKLIRDEKFIKHLKQAFMVEVSARVKLDELGKSLGESEALADLGSLAFKHVEWKQVFKELGGGLWRGSKEAGKEITGSIENEWERGTIMPDLSYCALTTASLVMPRSVAGILGTMFNLDDSKVCQSVVNSAKGVVSSSAKAGAVDLAQQSLKSLMAEQTVVLNRAEDVIGIVSKQVQTTVLLTHFWTAISQDEELINHLKTKYGDEGLARISGALRDISSSLLFSNKVGELSGEIKNIARKSLSALVLDHKGEGPNPLLLSVIQEQLSGHRRAIVHIYPGEGEVLKPGHLFQHSEGGE